MNRFDYDGGFVWDHKRDVERGLWLTEPKPVGGVRSRRWLVLAVAAAAIVFGGLWMSQMKLVYKAVEMPVWVAK